MLTKWMNKLINCSFTLFTNIKVEYFLLSNESSKTKCLFLFPISRKFVPIKKSQWHNSCLYWLYFINVHFCIIWTIFDTVIYPNIDGREGTPFTRIQTTGTNTRKTSNEKVNWIPVQHWLPSMREKNGKMTGCWKSSRRSRRSYRGWGTGLAGR